MMKFNKIVFYLLLCCCFGQSNQVASTPLNIIEQIRYNDFKKGINKSIFIDTAVLALDVSIQDVTYSSTFHLFTHGKPGELLINYQWLNAPQIADWLQKQKLLTTTQHLNIYGCHFAHGETGRAAVAYLKKELGITVAASDDLTGVDGDWDLEVGQALEVIELKDYRYNLQGALPMEPGMAALTCFSAIETSSISSDPDGYVLAVFDIREPDCDGSGNTDDSVTPNAPDNWQTASNGAYHHASWTAFNLGELFGIDLRDNTTSPDIYTTSFAITANPASELLVANGGTGGDVFKIDGTTGAITKLVSLPNTQYTYSGFGRYVGLGNISFNHENNVLYVTNLDNGLIYVINESTGAIISTYDPNTSLADNTSRYITQLLRAPFGIAYNSCENRLYYARPSATAASANGDGDIVTENTIFSLAVNSDGTLDASSIQTEIVLAGNTTASNSVEARFAVISDIEFSANCAQILISEQGWATRDSYFNGGMEQGIYRNYAHAGRVFRYTGASANWTTTTEYLVGTWSDMTNGHGGSDFGYSNYGTCGTDNACEDAVVTMGNALTISFDPLYTTNIYGLQISDIAGNSSGFPGNSYFVDLDGTISSGDNADKSLLGDVDVFGGGCCINPTADTPTTASGTCTSGTANNNATITIGNISNADIAGIVAGADYSSGVAYNADASTNAALYDASGGTVTFTDLMHATQYTIRVFNGADDCFTDFTSITTASISCCTNPTADAPTTAAGTCVNVTTPNNDATITVNNINDSDIAGIVAGADYSSGVAYNADANTNAALYDASGGTVTFTGLTHATQYTIRVFNGADDCFTDVAGITTASIDCSSICPNQKCGTITIQINN